MPHVIECPLLYAAQPDDSIESKHSDSPKSYFEGAYAAATGVETFVVGG